MHEIIVHISGSWLGRRFQSLKLEFASMGPHFFKCGKYLRTGNPIPATIASMGPHFFKCGKQRSVWRSLLPKTCFNGAALFQVRKVPECITPLPQDFRSFNGAALFQVRKVVSNACAYNAASCASMGPHFFKCGKNLDFATVAAEDLSASMGPHFFKCGKGGKQAGD